LKVCHNNKPGEGISEATGASGEPCGVFKEMSHKYLDIVEEFLFYLESTVRVLNH
jgi:hypothetical protein